MDTANASIYVKDKESANSGGVHVLRVADMTVSAMATGGTLTHESPHSGGLKPTLPTSSKWATCP